MLESTDPVTASSASLLYGKGVFTTIAINDGMPFLWEKHWHRLTLDAEKLAVDISGYEERSVADLLADAIAKNEIQNG